MKPIKTEDGSLTFFIEELDEYYHSIHGAFQESQTVFINAGLKVIPKDSCTIFEMGFGTGLNAFMSYLHSQQTELKVVYYGIEAYPISVDDAKLLNYAEVLSDGKEQSTFDKMHELSWDVMHELSPNFQFQKIKGKIEAFDFSKLPQIDLVYYDAFAPSAQAGLWEEELLRKVYESMSTNGILVTYCAKGSFKRTLKSIGFEVEGLPGPIGKREMTRAIKK